MSARDEIFADDVEVLTRTGFENGHFQDFNVSVKLKVVNNV